MNVANLVKIPMIMNIHLAKSTNSSEGNGVKILIIGGCSNMFSHNY